MKNIIEINLIENCSCELVSNIDDGTNSIQLIIKCDVSLNPKLTIDGTEMKLSANNVIYTIPESNLIGNGTIIFNLVDDNHAGNDFTITKSESSGNLYLKCISDFSYELKAIKKSSDNTSVDMSNYYTKNEVNNIVNEAGSSLKYHVKSTYFNFTGDEFFGKPIVVTGKLEAGVWLMNFRVRVFSNVPEGQVFVCVGETTITSNNFGFWHSSDGNEDMGSFTSIIESDNEFSQSLYVGIIGLDDNGELSNTSGTIWVRVDAVKIA